MPTARCTRVLRVDLASEPYSGSAVGADTATQHARSVESEGPTPVPEERDHTALRSQGFEDAEDDLLRRLLETLIRLPGWGADPARQFARATARGSGRGEVSRAVKRNSADRALVGVIRLIAEPAQSARCEVPEISRLYPSSSRASGERISGVLSLPAGY